MTVRDYITGKMESLNLTLSDADWSDIERSVSPEAEDTEANIRRAYTALAEKVLPFYVNRAESVSENGFSLTFNAQGVRTFYKWLCGFLGLDDALGAGSVIEDNSCMY
jgi:hypothetical protein